MVSFGRAAAALLILIAVFVSDPMPVQAEMVLHRGNGAEPETLDPQRLRGEGASWIAYDLFDPLLTLDVAGRPVPGAAERWTIDPNGRIYEIVLRDDAAWSDGSKVTADDFVFAWRRLADPATLSDYGYFIWPVKNGRAVNEGKLPTTALGIEALDARTLRITLEEPTGYFLGSLQHVSLAPVSRANVEKEGSDFIKPGKLISNGAYMLAESIPQGHVKLVRNPHFHSKESVKIDTVFYYPTENRETELRRFRAGELDVTYDVPDGQLDWLRTNMQDELRVAPYLGNYFYAINVTVDRWRDNKALRHALSLAIDRTSLADKITKGGERPAFTLVPPEVTDYLAPIPDVASWSQEQREVEAKRLIKEAGYGPGGQPLAVEIVYNTSENHRKMAIAIAAMWQRVLGAKVTLTNQEWKVFIDTRNSKSYRDIARHGWVADYDDALTFLKLFHSGIGRQNPSGYANPVFDELLDKSAKQLVVKDRQAMLAEAESLLMSDLPAIPIFYHATQNMVSRRVSGWQDNLRNLHLTRYMEVKR